MAFRHFRLALRRQGWLGVLRHPIDAVAIEKHAERNLIAEVYKTIYREMDADERGLEE